LERLVGIQEEATILRNERNRLLEREAAHKTAQTRLTEQCKAYEFEIYNLEKANAELRLRLVADPKGSSVKKR
jgi:hypothetical protein